MPGSVIYELQQNDRVIGGIDSASTDAAVRFYGRFVKGNLHKTNSKTAEMCKLVENAYRDVNIAFANELSIICDKAGIDVNELIDLASKHPRVKILRPGPGVGGTALRSIRGSLFLNSHPMRASSGSPVRSTITSGIGY